MLSVGGAPPAGAAPIAQSHQFWLPNGALNDQFGESVAIADGLIAVGAWLLDLPGGYPGAGGVFVYDAATGALVSEAYREPRRANQRIGWAISLADGVLVAGAPLDNANYTVAGSAYLYDARTGEQLRQLRPQPHTDVYYRPAGGTVDETFGLTVATGEGLAVVGAPGYFGPDTVTQTGAAYVFDVSTGDQLRVLRANDGRDDDGFGGSAIAIDDGLIVVGAMEHVADGIRSGAAYVFDAATGRQVSKLTPDDAAAGTDFGVSVAISGNTVVVGAPLDDENGFRAGAAYVFDALTGRQVRKLNPSSVNSNDRFGFSVATDGDRVAVGAPFHDVDGVWGGATYLFEAGSWNELGFVTPSDRAFGDLDTQFGWSVGIEGDLVVSGAPHGNSPLSDAGQAYLHAIDVAPGDYNGDGRIDAGDLAVWTSDYGLSDSVGRRGILSADGNHDGGVDAADYTVWRDRLAGVGAPTPEPDAATLLAAAAVGCRRRRTGRPPLWVSLPRAGSLTHRAAPARSLARVGSRARRCR
ncbi:dockerin type I domain-containing protein [Botrimarina sp.]|uniref:dockerin type I domain-containing protein n=1 Tax=Botrimarina sp. TaxID=2795802 RepID=UPI0032EA9C8B